MALPAAKARERWGCVGSERPTGAVEGGQGGVLALPAAKARERFAKRAKRVRALRG